VALISAKQLAFILDSKSPFRDRRRQCAKVACHASPRNARAHRLA
jgi:hypothetical protein